MSYYINLFFSMELTCIPRIIDKYIGKYYSNAVGNALMWISIMWLVVHYLFDSYLNILLKQMHFKLYVRTRLLNALWYCGFYGTGFLYCLGTIIRNNTSIFDYRKNLIMDSGNIPLHILMGLGLMGTFFFHSFTWTSIQYGFDNSCLTFLMLTLLPVTTYYSRRTELLMSLLALVSLVQFMYHFLRCLVCTMGKGHGYFTGIFYVVVGLFTALHVIVIPIFFIVPLIYNMRFGFNLSVIFLSVNMILWWICEAFSNPLYKFLNHWIKHSNLKNPRVCPSNLIECCLFAIRDDFTFNMCLVKWEIKQRKEQTISQRKPKDRGVFVQTLKCMVAIRRKLNNQRTGTADSYESDSDSDKDKPVDGDNDADSSEEDESSEEEEEEDSMKREYQEETARALLEDQQSHKEEVEKSESKDEVIQTTQEDGSETVASTMGEETKKKH